MKMVIGVAVLALTANLAVAATNVDISVPGARVQVGSPPPPPPPPRVIVEKETVVIKEKGDRGKHKGHYKDKHKHKKHKKHHDD